MKSGEHGKQCRMNVENSSFKCINEQRCQNSHEAGQNNKVGIKILAGLDQLFFKSFTSRIFLVIDHFKRNVVFLCKSESAGFRAVRDHAGNSDAVLLRPIFLNGTLVNRFEITASS